ncbi:MAG: hypothetical protein ACI4PM_05020 [Butyricicoccus sp.]
MDSVINVNRTVNGKTVASSESEQFRNEMETQMREICTALTSEEFDASHTSALIMIYALKYDRLLYSTVSNYIFRTCEKTAFDISDLSADANADALLKFAYLDDFNRQLKRAVKAIDSSLLPRIDPLLCRKIILKLNDHVHLVVQQIGHLKLSDEEYSQKFKEQIAPILDEVQTAQKSLDKKVDTAGEELMSKVNAANNEIGKFAKEYNAQIISLLGIFTAIAFLVFGSISEFNNIFSDISNISIFKLMILGSIWGICLINLLYVFLFCIGKMTGLNFSSAKKESHASIFQKYPIVWWSNYIVITIFFISSIMYFFVYRLDLTNRIAEMDIGNTAVLAFVLIALLVVAFIIIKSFKFLWIQCNPRYDYMGRGEQHPQKDAIAYIFVGAISFIMGIICVLLVISFL